MLKLRGGLLDLDPNTVAKTVTGLTAVNSAVMYLSPTKAAEMYGLVNPSPLICWFAEVAGGVFLQAVISSWLAIVNGMDYGTAVAWGGIPGLVQAYRDLLNGSTEKLGFGTMAQYMPTVINTLITAALFGKLSFLDAGLALKIWAGWGLFNGVAGYLMPAQFMKGWEAPLKDDKEEAMAKFFCGVLACTSVQIAAVALFDKSVVEGLAYSYAAFGLTQVDGLYITKQSETLGVDKNAGNFWLVVQFWQSDRDVY